MYLNLEDRGFETPTVESAMSWREQALWSLFAHLTLVVLVFFVPRLPVVQEAQQRRAERLREVAQEPSLQAALVAPPADDNRTFVFVQPRAELEPVAPPSNDAVLSDRDRTAQSPLRTRDPENRLPVSEGNSPEFIIADEGSDDGLDPVAVEGDDDVPGAEDTPAPEPQRADASAGQDEAFDAAGDVSDDPGVAEPADGEGPAFADSSLLEPGTGPGDPDPSGQRRIDLTTDGLLGQAVENLRQRVQRETFRNYSGDTGRFGPDIQFDTKGVEFGPWLRRFVAQIRRNWFVPYAIWSMHGHVVLTFNVHMDGSLTDLTVVKPSHVEAFNNSAFNALRSSNPTQPLPPEYPDDHAFFTVTFYFNEMPPA